jgi:hypothetical protein
MQVLGKNLSNIILYGPKEGTIKIILVLGSIQILSYESLGFQTYGNIPGLVTLAVHAKVQHAFALLEIAHTELTEFFTAQAVIQQRGEDSTITFAFQGVCWRRLEQHTRLLVTERWRKAFLIII